jgi:hypothetical protein
MWRATVTHGEVMLPVRLRQWAAGHDGARLIIEEEKRVRTRSQNSYYWVYLGVIAEETGDNPDDLHEFFKRKLLHPVFKTIRGEEIKLPRSTTELTKLEFGEYLDKICALTNIPLPDPQAAGYLPH